MRYDLVIVGGGLVGASLALALRHTTLTVALIDARLPTKADPRLFALNYSSCQFLENLGVWDALKSRVAPIHEVHVSRQGRFGTIRMRHTDLDLPLLGNVVPAYEIESALNTQLETQANVTLYRPATLQALTQTNEEATLLLTTEQGDVSLAASLVIGADGTTSTVRDLLQIASDEADYQQSAIVTRTQLKHPHASVAYERFHQHGAIAMLPLNEQECATIWSASREFAAQLMAMSEAEFTQALQRTFGDRLGPFNGIGQRHCFPLRGVTAKKQVEGCVMLLGNAAHTLHPIAAQGLNLALYEVAALVDGIMQKLTRQEKVTVLDLQQIQQQFQQQRSLSTNVSHRLAGLFASDSWLISHVLQLGMIGFNHVTPIKRHFMRRIIGRIGVVPSLLLSAQES